ncbi:MAG TPA: hypothetical protein ENJ00_07470, partial [Phycisphaerales bacterium]|nr:hypothetical protein [Phycisphaerales bacterium]
LVASNSFARTGMLADGEFAFPDERTARSGFKEFVRRERIRFLWSRDHNGKIPDLIVNLNGIVLIAEHKHIKEGGGGQDKQIVELIEFIRQNESRADIRYMAFLDGIMFNRLMVRHAQGIAEKQRARIYKSLEEYPENYFVNTAGFKSVIQSGTTTI